MKKLKEEVEKQGLKLSVNENGKEGKSKMIASCVFLENELSQFSKEEGVTLADSVENLGVDMTTRNKKLGRMSPKERLKLRRQRQLRQARRARPPFLCSWKHTAWRWKMRSPRWPLSIGQKEYGQGNGVTNKRKRG